MSYENEIKKRMENNELIDDRLDLSFIRYLWNAGPITSLLGHESHHEFFKKISVLSSFTDNEIRIFTKYLHLREFVANETVFKQGDSGYGFYFIFNGAVNIFSNHDSRSEGLGELVIKLEKYQYFGEMGLLEEFNKRSASVVAAENTSLLGIFKPDLEQMLKSHPVLGAKFLRETALIMANRMGQLTREIILLKKKLRETEQKLT